MSVNIPSLSDHFSKFLGVANISVPHRPLSSTAPGCQLDCLCINSMWLCLLPYIGLDDTVIFQSLSVIQGRIWVFVAGGQIPEGLEGLGDRNPPGECRAEYCGVWGKASRNKILIDGTAVCPTICSAHPYAHVSCSCDVFQKKIVHFSVMCHKHPFHRALM